MSIELVKGVYGIVDADQERDIDEVLDAFLSCGTKLIQLRMKHRSTEEMLATGRRVQQACRQAGALFILNDRPDIAAVIEADRDEVRAELVREIVAWMRDEANGWMCADTASSEIEAKFGGRDG